MTQHNPNLAARLKAFLSREKPVYMDEAVALDASMEADAHALFVAKAAVATYSTRRVQRRM